MKTSTKVKIAFSVILCLLLLAAIAKKTRENFQSEMEPSQAPIGNRNPAEVAPSEMQQSGHQINKNNDNLLANLENSKGVMSRTCKLSNKTDAERSLAIQNDAIEAKNQLDFLVQKKMEYLAKVREEHNNKPDPDPCKYLRFPAILS